MSIPADPNGNEPTNSGTGAAQSPQDSPQDMTAEHTTEDVTEPTPPATAAQPEPEPQAPPTWPSVSQPGYSGAHYGTTGAPSGASDTPYGSTGATWGWAPSSAADQPTGPTWAQSTTADDPTTPGWAHPSSTPGAPGAAPHAQSSRHGRRLAAVAAAIALVLASGGVGAAIATKVHDNTKSFSNAAANVPSNNGNGNGNNPFGNGNNNPFGGQFPGSDNGNGNGSGSNGSGTNGSGNVAGIDMDSITSKTDPAVVNIYTTIGTSGEAAGTGMIISSDGEVLTNNHVIAQATTVKVQIGGKGSMHTAHVVGYDVADDVALVKIDNVSGLPTVDTGKAADLKAGDPVVAIGNALGKGGTPSAVTGSVTALDQSVTAGDETGDAETLHGMVQIQASIQPGDSGGPLVNANGEVVGMDTAASAGRFSQDSNSTVAFAIPIEKALSIVHQIQSGDESDGVHIGARAVLGIEVQRDNSSDNSGNNFPFPFGNGSGDNSSTNGAAVSGVQSGSAADKAGIAQGDTITSINGKSVSSSDDLTNDLANKHPGDKVSVGWVDSNGNHHSASVRLSSGPPA